MSSHTISISKVVEAIVYIDVRMHHISHMIVNSFETYNILDEIIFEELSKN